MDANETETPEVTEDSNAEKNPEDSDTSDDHAAEQTGEEEENTNEYVPDIESVYSETTEYPELADFIIDYYAIPEEYQSETRYYYNYVDLNADGRAEIVAAVVGEYTSGSAGDNILILSEQDGVLTVLEAFSMVRTPVLVSDRITNGWNELIFPVYGGGIDPGYVVCHYVADAGYQTEENVFVEGLDETVSGRQYLSNNLIDDLDKGTYLTLAPRIDEGKN